MSTYGHGQIFTSRARPDRPVFSTGMITELTGIHEQTLWRWAQKGIVPCLVRRGRASHDHGARYTGGSGHWLEWDPDDLPVIVAVRDLRRFAEHLTVDWTHLARVVRRTVVAGGGWVVVDQDGRAFATDDPETLHSLLIASRCAITVTIPAAPPHAPPAAASGTEAGFTASTAGPASATSHSSDSRPLVTAVG